MSAILIAVPMVAGAILALVLWWIEARTNGRGVGFGILGVSMLVVGGYSMLTKPLVLAAVFVLQGIGFLYFARWRWKRHAVERGSARAPDAPTSEPPPPPNPL